MKRTISVFICILLLVSCVPGASAEEYDGALRTSRYCAEAPMSGYRDLFSRMEQSGLNAPLTRAMTAYILSGIVDADLSVSRSPNVSDVDPGSVYAPSVFWAVENGLFALESDLFDPDQAISREDLALAMDQCLLSTGRRLPEINERYSFMDAGLMNNLKREAAATVQRGGVMLENADGYFCPYDSISVAEAESVFLRFAGGMRIAFPLLPVSTVTRSEAVSDDWFDDACFIGHSQVVGMSEYFNLPNADFYAVIGHKAFEVLQFPYYTMPSGRMGTLKSSLEMGSYGKVYVMLGVNDFSNKAGREDEFLVPMRQILDLVKATQPGATIYLISLAPVGRETKNNLLYNPENAIYYSQLIKGLAREYGTEYLDLFRALCDEDGYLRGEYDAGDGIHIKAKQYGVVKDFLKCHTLS